jgi:hypothetical protein
MLRRSLGGWRIGFMRIERSCGGDIGEWCESCFSEHGILIAAALPIISKWMDHEKDTTC